MMNYSCRQYDCWPPSGKECLCTYTSIFKLYKVSYYRLYKVCPQCGCEFDCQFYEDCPVCSGNPGNNPDNIPPQPGFVFFPELLLATSPLELFPELAFEL